MTLFRKSVLAFLAALIVVVFTASGYAQDNSIGESQKAIEPLQLAIPADGETYVSVRNLIIWFLLVFCIFVGYRLIDELPISKLTSILNKLAFILNKLALILNILTPFLNILALILNKLVAGLGRPNLKSELSSLFKNSISPLFRESLSRSDLKYALIIVVTLLMASYSYSEYYNNKYGDRLNLLIRNIPDDAGSGIIDQDDEKAIAWFHTKAIEDGEAKAQFYWAFALVLGLGADRNDVEAVKWFLKAAEQGNKTAQYNSGVAYHYGWGVDQDHKKAVIWFRKAAADRRLTATDLGYALAFGFSKAAEQGFAATQNALNFAYYHGRGVDQDHKEAVKWFKWYRKAAEQGLAATYLSLYALVFGFREAAVQGLAAAAQNALNFVYYHGQGLDQNHKETVKWVRKAAKQDYAQAQNALGFAYYHGQGVKQDDEKAFKWFRKAADQGHAAAQFNLGVIYDKGREGVDQDYKEAFKWYRKAAEQGLAEAQNALGFAYDHGLGVDKDHKEAAKWYRKAAEQDYAPAQFNLGASYANREGVIKDIVSAHMWFNLAASQQGLDDATKARDSLEERMTPSQREEAVRRAHQWIAWHRKDD